VGLFVTVKDVHLKLRFPQIPSTCRVGTRDEIFANVMCCPLRLEHIKLNELPAALADDPKDSRDPPNATAVLTTETFELTSAVSTRRREGLCEMMREPLSMISLATAVTISNR
jgi:hypothetical protein